MGTRLGATVVVLLVCATCLGGCAAPTEIGAESQAAEEFDSMVAEADAAMAAGDARSAFYLYNDALDLPSAQDPDGSIAERRDHAKSLVIARSILDDEPDPFDPSQTVAVIVEHSDAETETAEAKRRVLAFFEYNAAALRESLPDLRADIRSQDEYRLPASSAMIDGMRDHWQRSLSRLDDEFGIQAMTALELLVRAAGEMNMAGEREWVNEALADTDLAEATLDELDAHLRAWGSALDD